jgi:hypothetical protein
MPAGASHVECFDGVLGRPSVDGSLLAGRRRSKAVRSIWPALSSTTSSSSSSSRAEVPCERSVRPGDDGTRVASEPGADGRSGDESGSGLEPTKMPRRATTKGGSVDGSTDFQSIPLSR